MLAIWDTTETRMSWREHSATTVLWEVFGWPGTHQALPLWSLKILEMHLMLWENWMEGESTLSSYCYYPFLSCVLSSLSFLMWCRAQELVWHAGACWVIHWGKTCTEPYSSSILEQTPAWRLQATQSSGETQVFAQFTKFPKIYFSVLFTVSLADVYFRVWKHLISPNWSYYVNLN